MVNKLNMYIQFNNNFMKINNFLFLSDFCLISSFFSIIQVFNNLAVPTMVPYVWNYQDPEIFYSYIIHYIIYIQLMTLNTFKILEFCLQRVYTF